MRQPTEMELRVAKTISIVYETEIDTRRPIPHELSSAERGKILANRWLPYARAAIHAMREPTSTMIEAGSHGFGLGLGRELSLEDRWRRMIDAASPPEK